MRAPSLRSVECDTAVRPGQHWPLFSFSSLPRGPGRDRCGRAPSRALQSAGHCEISLPGQTGKTLLITFHQPASWSLLSLKNILSCLRIREWEGSWELFSPSFLNSHLFGSAPPHSVFFLWNFLSGSSITTISPFFLTKINTIFSFSSEETN